MPASPPPFVPGLVEPVQRFAKRAIRDTDLWRTAVFGDDRPLPSAFSLSAFRQWPFNQSSDYGKYGPGIGTCWANAAVQAFQIQTAAQGEYEPVHLSRLTVCYQGSVLAGGRNPCDGNSVTYGFMAMSDAPHGIGVCHEEKWPYHADRRYLSSGPPEGAIADASLNRVHAVGECDFGTDGTAWKVAIHNGHPVDIGIDWPGGWDSAVNGSGQATGIGQIVGGHAVVATGWIDNWDGGKTWWQIENSHGPIYHPLPADVAALVPGYKPTSPDKTHCFWTRSDWLASILNSRNTESLIAAGLTGFQERQISFAHAIMPVRIRPELT